MSFVNLAVFSNLSAPIGGVDILRAIAFAKNDGQESIAIIENMSMFGLLQFHKLALREGVKPITGARLTFGDHRAIFIAKNHSGFQYISQAISAGRLSESGHCYLADMSQSNDVVVIAEAADADFIAALAGKFHHTYLSSEFVTSSGHASLAPVAAVRSAYFVQAGEHEMSVALASIRTAQDILKPNDSISVSAAMTSSSFAHSSLKHIDGAIENARQIELMSNFVLEQRKPELPEFGGLDEKSQFALLANNVKEGLQSIGKIDDEEYKSRARFELKVIREMGFVGYHLIVADYIKFARDCGIGVGPARGSSAGSLVCYLIGITQVDPIKHSLLFERYLNPDRVSYPDIDTDFASAGRDRVIDYLLEEYGDGHVSKISTIGTFGAKSAIRAACRYLGIDFAQSGKIADLVPNSPNKTVLLGRKDTTEKFWNEVSVVPALRPVAEIASFIEGQCASIGTHAAGIIISGSHISSIAPLIPVEGSIVPAVGLDKDDAEKLGLVKMDLLGLSTLDLLAQAESDIKAKVDEEFSLREIDINDDLALSMLRRGITKSIFQFESQGITNLIARVEPKQFEDIVAVTSLYRPGPMELSEDFVANTGVAPHPLLQNITSETRGIIIYQEQVMKAAQIVGGFTLAEADLMRRAMGKKDVEQMGAMRSKFVSGAKKNNVSEEDANHVFDLLDRFSGYGFNKSHAVAYSIITMQTAYVKAHYPEIFYAAAMQTNIGDGEKIAALAKEARDSFGIEVLSPCINSSDYLFTASKGKIRYGLSGVFGIGSEVIENICFDREIRGEYRDLKEFIDRLPKIAVLKKVATGLAMSGALDAFGVSRSAIIATLDEIGKPKKKKAKKDLFGADEEESFSYVEAEQLTPKEIYAGEVKYTGIAFSASPLGMLTRKFRKFAPLTIDKVVPSDRAIQSVCGEIKSVRKIKTKNGDDMCFLTIEDESGSLDAVVFPRTYATMPQVKKGDFVLAKGKVDRGQNKDGAKQLIIDKLLDQKGALQLIGGA